MPSVTESIEEREVAARQRVELVRNELDRLVAELKAAEAARDRLVIAKETVSEVLSEAGEPKGVRVSRGRPVEPEPPVVRAARLGGDRTGAVQGEASGRARLARRGHPGFFSVAVSQGGGS
ncbi:MULTISPECIES: hypothetical protein [unclassified Streptomyces]|uniref:hypothetical protein n=1 Tax=Streptomyces sp. NPDC127129 TaxID=3345373 RepID=UPI00364536FB